MIKAMRFNAHSLLLCGLFAYICMVIMRFYGYLRRLMALLIYFRVTPGKWLESACNVVIWGLYDGVGGADAKVYPPVGLHFSQNTLIR